MDKTKLQTITKYYIKPAVSIYKGVTAHFLDKDNNEVYQISHLDDSASAVDLKERLQADVDNFIAENNIVIAA